MLNDDNENVILVTDKDTTRMPISIYEEDDRGVIRTCHGRLSSGSFVLITILSSNKGMSLDAVDGHGRNALDFTESSKALLACKWTVKSKARHAISSFMLTQFRL